MNSKDESAISSWQKDKKNLSRINSLLVRARQKESEIPIEDVKDIITFIENYSYSFYAVSSFPLIEQNIGRYLLEKCPESIEDISKGISHLESSIRKLEMQGRDKTYLNALSYYYLSKLHKKLSDCYFVLMKEDFENPGPRSKFIYDMDTHSANENIAKSKEKAKRAITILEDLILVSPEDKFKKKLIEIDKWLKEI